MLHESYSATWFSTQGLSDLVRTRAGTKPGDPLGDILFNFIMAKVLWTLEGELKAAGVLDEVPHVPDRFCPAQLTVAMEHNITICDVSFVDDSAIPVSAGSAYALVSKLRSATEICVRVFARFSMRLNFKKGKSEAVVSLRGDGAGMVATQVYGNDSSTVEFQCNGSQCKLHIVPWYKHLGGFIDAVGTERTEIGHRADRANTARAGLTRALSRVPELDQCIKVTLASSLVLTRLLYNCGTWGPIRDAQLRTLRAPWAKALRSITGDTHHAGTSDFVSDDSVAAKLTLPAFASILTYYRIRYIVRLIAHAPQLLLALLHEAFRLHLPVADQMQADFQLMLGWPELDEVARGPHPQHHLVEVIRANTVAFKDLVRARQLKEAKALRRRLDELRSAGPAGTPAARPNPLPAVLPYFCYVCGADFDNPVALGTHLQVMHAYRNDARSYAASATCRVCRIHYHTRANLVRHLREAKTDCLKICQAAFEPLPRDEVQALDAEDAAAQKISRAAGHQRPPAQIPPFLTCGPPRPAALLAGYSAYKGVQHRRGWRFRAPELPPAE